MVLKDKLRYTKHFVLFEKKLFELGGNKREVARSTLLTIARGKTYRRKDKRKQRRK